MVPPYCGSRRRSSGSVMGKSAFYRGVSPAKCAFSYTLSIIDVRLKFIKHFSPGFLLFRGSHKFRRIFCVLFQLFAAPVLRCAVLRKRRFGGSPLPGEIFRRSLLLFRRKTGILGSRIPSPCGVFQEERHHAYAEIEESTAPDGGLPGLSGTGPLRHAGPLAGADARCP